MTQADDRAGLWNLLRDLHPIKGVALLLGIGFQLPHQTVATVLGVPQDAVSRLCDRGLRRCEPRRASYTRSMSSRTLRRIMGGHNHG